MIRSADSDVNQDELKEIRGELKVNKRAVKVN